MYGYLRLLRPNKNCPEYDLEEGTHTIGADKRCNIHLKQVNQKDLLLDVHAKVKVHSDGVATIHNQSDDAPVTVNDKRMTSRPQILMHGSKFKVLDKEFQYMNDRFKDLVEDDVVFAAAKHNILEQNPKRKSVNPLGSTKNTPIFKTKTKSPPINRSLVSKLPSSRPSLQRTLNTSTTKTPKAPVKRPAITPRLTLPAKPFTTTVTSSVKKQATPYRLSTKSPRLSIKKPTAKVLKAIDIGEESESDLANELDESLDQAVNESKQKGAGISGGQTQNKILRLSKSFKTIQREENISIKHNNDTSEDEEVQHLDTSRKSRRSYKKSLNDHGDDTSKRHSRTSTAGSDSAKQGHLKVDDIKEQHFNESSSESSPEFLENDKGPNKSRASLRQSQIRIKSVSGQFSRKSHEEGDNNKTSEDETSADEQHFEESDSENLLDFEEANASLGKTSTKSQINVKISGRYSENNQSVVSTTEDQSEPESSDAEEIEHLKAARHSKISQRQSLIQPELDNGVNASVSGQSQRNTSIRSTRVTREINPHAVAYDEEIQNQSNISSTSQRKSLNASTEEDDQEVSGDGDIEKYQRNVSSRTTSPRRSLKATMEENQDASDDEEFVNTQTNTSSKSPRTTSPRKSLRMTKEQDYHQTSEEADYQANVSSRPQRNTSSRRSLRAPRDIHDALEEENMNNERNTSTRSPRKSLKASPSREKDNHEASEDEDIKEYQKNISSKTISSGESFKATMEENHHEGSDSEEFVNNETNTLSKSQRTTSPRKSLRMTREQDHHHQASEEEDRANYQTDISSRSHRNTSSGRILRAPQEAYVHDEDITNNQTRSQSRSQRTISPRQSLKARADPNHEASEDEDIEKYQTNISSRTISPRKSLKTTMEQNHQKVSIDEEFANNQTNTLSMSRRTTSARKSLRMTGEQEDQQASEEADMANYQANISSRSQRNTSSRRSLRAPRESHVHDASDEENMNNLTNTSCRSQRTTSLRKSLKANENDNHEASEDQDIEEYQTNISSRTISPRKSLKAMMEQNLQEASDDEEFANNQTNASSKSRKTISPNKSRGMAKEQDYQPASEEEDMANYQANISSRSQRNTSSRRSLRAPRASHVDDASDEENMNNLTNTSSRSRRPTPPRKSLKAKEYDNHEAAEDEDVEEYQMNISTRTISPRKSLKATMEENLHESSDDEQLANNQTNTLSKSRRTTSPRKSLRMPREQDCHQASDELEMSNNQTNISSRSQRNTSARKSLKVTSKQDNQNTSENEDMAEYQTNILSESQKLNSSRRSLKAGSKEGSHETSDDEVEETKYFSRTTSPRKCLSVTASDDEEMANNENEFSEDEVLNQKQTNMSARSHISPRKSVKVMVDEDYDLKYMANISSRSLGDTSVRKSIKTVEPLQSGPEEEDMAQVVPRKSRSSLKPSASRNSYRRSNVDLLIHSVGTIQQSSANKSRLSLRPSTQNYADISSSRYSKRSTLPAQAQEVSSSRISKLGLSQSHQASDSDTDDISSMSHKDVSLRKSLKNTSENSRKSRPSYRQSQLEVPSKDQNYSRRSTLPANLLDIPETSLRKNLRQSESIISPHHDVEGDDDVFMSGDEITSATRKSARKSDAYLRGRASQQNDSHCPSKTLKTGPKRSTIGGYFSGKASVGSNNEFSITNSINAQSDLTKEDELLVNKSGGNSYSRRKIYSSDIGQSSEEMGRGRYVTARKPAAKINALPTARDYDEDSDEPSPDFSLVLLPTVSDHEDPFENISSRNTSTVPNSRETSKVGSQNVSKNIKRMSVYDDSTQDMNEEAFRLTSTGSTLQDISDKTKMKRPSRFDESTQEANAEAFRLTSSTGSTPQDASKRARSYKRESLSNSSTVPNSRETSAARSRNVSRDNKEPKRKSVYDESTQDMNAEAFRITSTGSTPQDASGKTRLKRHSTFDKSTLEANAEAFRFTLTENTPQDVSRKNTLKRQSTFDGSIREARRTTQDVSKRSTSRRQSILKSDESIQDTRMFYTSRKAITIDDDTVEVLSPVQPVASGRKSGRKSQSDTVKSKASTAKLGDSSLTNTQLSQSTSSVVTVSSRSFSSFKKAYSQLDGGNNVVDKRSPSEANIKSSSDYTPDRQESRSKRFNSEIFEPVSFTSTPFAKSVGVKKSLGSAKKSLLQVTKRTSIIHSEVIVSSMEVTRDRSQSVVEISDSTMRRSSRTSAAKNGHHNCISCGETSSLRRSKSLSDARDLSLPVDKTENLSKSVDVSSLKNNSVKGVRASSKNSPLLHRKSLVSLVLSVNTPEKQGESEDETPKSHVKPARRSSKSNQSTYIPVLEDITPVTPERLQVSGFTETFKTPINTPGLFENIRKSALRKRLSESAGSALKKARIDIQQDDDNSMAVTDAKDISPAKRQQKSPRNRLSNFEGVKRLMKTPPKSPKNDLRNIPNLRRIMEPKAQHSPRNDLTEPLGVKKLFKTAKQQKQPKDDLMDVSGVQNLFNVSGTEVLHQGSDIENSEDLFTKLTGKRPMRSYNTSRGQSLSPMKSDDAKAHRKTMGDLPLCSPRVQQWVEEHSNFADEPEQNCSKKVSEQRESRGNNSLLENVSEEPNKRSRAGRSLSLETEGNQQNRRYTQGDTLKRHSKRHQSAYDEEIANDLIKNMPDNMEVKKRVARSLSAKKPPRDFQKRVTQAYNLKLSNEAANDSLNLHNVSNKATRDSRRLSPKKSARKSAERGSLKRTGSIKRVHEDEASEKRNVTLERTLSAQKSRDSQDHVDKKSKLSLNVSQSKNTNLDQSVDLFDESSDEELTRDPDQTLLNNLTSKNRSRVGRSVSPKKSSSSAFNRRKTQGDLTKSSPKVTDWKSQRPAVVTSSVVKEYENNVSNREDVQIATISSSVNIDLEETDDEQRAVDSPIVKRGARGKAATKKTAPKKVSKRKEIEPVHESPVAKRGRRAEKVIEEHQVEDASEEEHVAVPQVQIVTRRGRCAQHKEIAPSVKAAKPKKGKVSQQEDVTEITPILTSKTKKGQETPVITEKPVNTLTKPKRGRAKQAATEVVEQVADTPTKRGRRKQAEREVTVPAIESIPRSRRGKAVQEAATPDVEIATRPKRGKAQKKEGDAEEIRKESSMETVKAKADTQTEVVQSDEIEANPNVISTMKPKRGKGAAKESKKAVVEAMPETEAKLRPRRGKVANEINETPDEVVSTRTTRRGQKNVKPAIEPPEIDVEYKVAKRGEVLEPTEKPEEKELPAKARRGRANQKDAPEKEIAPVPSEEQEVMNEPLEAVKKGAGRKRVLSRADSSTDVNYPIKKRAKKVRFEPEGQKMELQASRPARGGRRRNIDATVVVEEPIQTKKATRGRTKSIKPDVELEPMVEIDEERSNQHRKNVTELEPAPKSTRGRGKIIAKVEPTVEETQTDTEEAGKAKTTRSKAKKNVRTEELAQFVDEEVQFNRPARTRGKKIIQETISEDVDVPVKSARGKAKKNLNVEEVVDNAEEEVVETKTKATSRARKAVPIEQEEVQSRPTRARSRRNHT